VEAAFAAAVEHCAACPAAGAGLGEVTA